MTMPQVTLEQLKTIDPALLAEVVRQDQCSPDFAVTSWSVERLSDKGIANPDGLFRFHGRGCLGGMERSWSVVLKILREFPDDIPLTSMEYGRRELSLASSGLLANLPGPVVVPRVYRACEQDGRGWIWMEHVQSASSQRWIAHDYAKTARLLGRWQGAYLCGVPLPEAPWLCRDLHRSWLAAYQVGAESGWRNPLFRRHLSAAAQSRYLALRDDAARFCSALEALPRVLSHGDLGRRNLFIREWPDGRSELVVIDWEECGPGPLGADLGELVGLSALHLEYEPMDTPRVAAAAIEGYGAGLRDASWTGNADLARLGYVAGISIHLGASFPALVPWFIVKEGQAFALQQFDLAGEELLQKWIPLFLYVLDCADEARKLMAQLNL